MNIPFIGGAYLDRYGKINHQESQNLFPTVDSETGKVNAIIGTPGLELWAAPGTGEVRGLHEFGDYLYAVIGTTLYKISTNGTATAMTGAVAAATNNKVWLQNNGTDLAMVGGGKGYYLLATTVTEIANLNVLGTPVTLAYQDGYFISSMASSGQFFISGSYSATAWDALDYSTAEGDPDYLQVVISENRELWLLGKTSYEVWYNSGDSEFPFDRISGAVRKIGCIAPNSACGFMGTVVWLDDRRYVRASNGYNAEKISTSQVDYHVASYGKVDDAVGYTYSQEGHTFYVLTFPTEDKTWVYDFSTKYWHTRASGESDNRHPANCYAKFDDKHLIGDYSNGRIYYYDLGKFTDNGAPLRRIRSARAIRDDRKRVYHSRFELDFDLG